MSVKEGSLGAPIRHTIDWNNPDFTDEKKLDDELRRVFDICHGCRRCFNLCESFPNLFDMIDNQKQERSMVLRVKISARWSTLVLCATCAF